MQRMKEHLSGKAQAPERAGSKKGGACLEPARGGAQEAGCAEQVSSPVRGWFLLGCGRGTEPADGLPRSCQPCSWGRARDVSGYLRHCGADRPQRCAGSTSEMAPPKPSGSAWWLYCWKL